jgi:acetyltransferase-like isoleucine patch superfamily enzyme
MEINIFDKITTRLQMYISRFYLIYLKVVENVNVNVPKRIIFVGLPVISTEKNTRIIFGENCVFVSKRYANPLGIINRTIIRTLNKDAEIVFGNCVSMSGATICAMKRIVIGNDVTLGANTTIIDNDFHPTNPLLSKSMLDKKELIKKMEVLIEDHVMTGMNVIILKGVIIGKGSYIGANCLVYKSVPEGSMVVNDSMKVLTKQK